MATPVTSCFTPIFGQAVRLTKVDGCGRPVYGPGGMAVSSSFSDLKFTMNIDAATEVNVKNAADQICVYDPGTAALKSIAAALTLCQVDPGLVGLINPAWPLELDGQGNIIGWRTNTNLGTDGGGYALEVWTGVVGDDVCDDPSATGAWGYILVPFLTGGTPSDIDITNKDVSFAFTGTSKTNSKWGTGPYPVINDASGKPGPLLAPVASDEMMITMVTTVPPPAPTCGTQPLQPLNPLALAAVQDGTNKKLFTFNATNAIGSTATFDFGDSTATETVPVVTNAASTEHTYAAAGTNEAKVTSGSGSATAEAVAQ